MLANPFLYWIDKFYGFFIAIGSNLQSLFLLYLRLTWGHQFFLSGVDKLEHIAKTTEIFIQLHIPYPLFHSYEVGLMEAIGGALLMIGFASRVAAIPLIIIMLTALTTAHMEALKNFDFLINDPHILVMQQPYPYLFTSLLVFIFGPGRVSLDAWFKRWVNRQPRY